MSDYETVAVPFIAVGNRRGLSRHQIEEVSWLAEFYNMFKDSFEIDCATDTCIFIEPVEEISSDRKDNQHV